MYILLVYINIVLLDCNKLKVFVVVFNMVRKYLERGIDLFCKSIILK